MHIFHFNLLRNRQEKIREKICFTQETRQLIINHSLGNQRSSDCLCSHNKWAVNNMRRLQIYKHKALKLWAWAQCSQWVLLWLPSMHSFTWLLIKWCPPSLFLGIDSQRTLESTDSTLSSRNDVLWPSFRILFHSTQPLWLVQRRTYTPTELRNK